MYRGKLTFYLHNQTQRAHSEELQYFFVSRGLCFRQKYFHGLRTKDSRGDFSSYCVVHMNKFVFQGLTSSDGCMMYTHDNPEFCEFAE